MKVWHEATPAEATTTFSPAGSNITRCTMIATEPASTRWRRVFGRPRRSRVVRSFGFGLPLVLLAGPCTANTPDVFKPIRNMAYTANQELSQQEITNSAAGPYGGFSNDAFTAIAERADNGPQPGQGQFRVECDYSHFLYDDPIIKPNQFGAAHLHMFWGNTSTNAASRVTPGGSPDDRTQLLENGGGTCQGGVLNRSAYWMPAMYAGAASPNRQLVLPKSITIYYKSYRPNEVNALPQGVEFLSGNIAPGGVPGTSFAANPNLTWGCYEPDRGLIVEERAVIPTDCTAAQTIIAIIQFPECIAVDGNGQPVLRSADHLSHTKMIENIDPCPASHPYRVPQISYLVQWPNLGTAAVKKWRLSCDAGFNGANPPTPGGCLHADWIGGWNAPTMDAWITGCHKSSSGPRNCSNGQTGQNGTGRSLRDIDRSRTSFLVPDPCSSCFVSPTHQHN
jgi:hypothetical protein